MKVNKIGIQTLIILLPGRTKLSLMTSPLCRWLGRRDSSIKVISQLFGPPYSLLNLDPRASWLLLKINTMLEFQSCALTEKNPSNVPRRFQTGPQNKLLKQFKQQKKCQRSQEGPLRGAPSPRKSFPAGTTRSHLTWSLSLAGIREPALALRLLGARCLPREPGGARATSGVKQMKRKLNSPPAGQPYSMSVAERHSVSVPGTVVSKERLGQAAAGSI